MSSAPSQDILGSYFPSWMLCAVAGIVLAIFIHLLLVKFDIERYVPGKALVYLGMTLSLTSFTWLIWFGN